MCATSDGRRYRSRGLRLEFVGFGPGQAGLAQPRLPDALVLGGGFSCLYLSLSIYIYIYTHIALLFVVFIRCVFDVFLIILFSAPRGRLWSWGGQTAAVGSGTVTDLHHGCVDIPIQSGIQPVGYDR